MNKGGFRAYYYFAQIPPIFSIKNRRNLLQIIFKKMNIGIVCDFYA